MRSTRTPLHLAAATLLLLGLSLPAGRVTAAAPNPPPLDPANLDPNTKPGVDFFRYANGGWLDKHPIPPEYSRFGAFEQLIERNNDLLHAILDECAAAKTPARGSVQQLVGDFYAAGMDEAAVEAAGVKPLQPEFDRIAALKDRAELPALVARHHALGLNVLFRFDVDADQKDSLNQIAQVYQGGLGLPDRDYYMKDDDRSKTLRAQYEEHVTKMFTLFGDAPETAAANAKTVFAIETELAKASKTRVELRDPEANYNRMTVPDLVKLAPGFDWAAYFAALGAKEPGNIDVSQPEFFKRAGQLAAERPVADWQTYLRWHLLRATAPDLSKAFVDENFRFYGAVLTGAKEIRPRWKRVLREVDPGLGNGGLGEALGQLYLAKTFTPEAKTRALAMIEDLRGVLRDRLNTLDWMGPETRTAALKKLQSFDVKIGYPDKFRDYAGLEVKRQPHVLNVLATNAFDMKRTLAKINRPVDRTEWAMSPPTVNAYYNPTRNEIVFPAGILQPPFFDPKADDAVNYGGIGGVIGHEMTHGFDDQGRQYDAQGNLKNWWTDEDLKRFKQRSEAIVKQFDAYQPIEGQRINGSLTQGENIADLGGLKVAYAALERALERQGPGAKDKKIDGFTPAQRFFLSWAQVWRNNIRPEALRLRLTTDPHSPGQYRCNGPLANLPEFQAAFAIPDGSPMLRPAAERVQIW